MIRTLLCSVLLLSFFSCATAPSAAPAAPVKMPLWLDLTPGPYAVGFRVSVLPTDPHPLQISVWYPAERGGSPMTYRDYILVSLSEKGNTQPTEVERTAAVTDAHDFLTKAGISEASTQSLFSAPMYARREAPGIAKKFPLVLVLQGNGQSASGQAVLSEYLASHGYVVATFPSITRLTGQMSSVDDIVGKAEAEVKDIERTIAAIGNAPNVISDPLTIVAHSFGSRSGMLYAMHHPVIAFVSLEGGIGTATGQMAMLESKMLDFKAPMPPILHFYELNDDRVVPEFRMFKSLRTPDLQLERKNSMQHVHFSSDGYAAAMLPDMAKITQGGPDLRSDVVSVAKQTLAFIDKQWAAKRAKP